MPSGSFQTRQGLPHNATETNDDGKVCHRTERGDGVATKVTTTEKVCHGTERGDGFYRLICHATFSVKKSLASSESIKAYVGFNVSAITLVK